MDSATRKMKKGGTEQRRAKRDAINGEWIEDEGKERYIDCESKVRREIN